ncbi:MAG TPA: THUMP domain-containing protein [Thermoanaerobaculia bacterium]|nr:THUMP domain-containing protein [Thermoanaerobaculia bacterium]
MTQRVILLRLSGDLYTKARKTRLRFLRRLGHNLEDALSTHALPHRLEKSWSRFVAHVEVPPGAADPCELLARVFGIQSVSEIERRPWSTLDDVVTAGEELFRDAVAGRRFAVRARRRGDRRAIPFDSLAVERALGRALLPHAAGVQLHDPEVTAHVEVEPGAVHFFRERVAGRGGLPVGVEGRGVALVSGGFDSAVAAWLMLKRGVQLEYVFCNLGGDPHRAGALAVVRLLAERWSYGYRPRLHELDFRPLAEAIRRDTDPRLWQLLLKRQMLRGAEAIARRGGASGIVTGDAIGQVSSQTLQNLAVVSQAAGLPALRPLLGSNKEEILALAREVGVFAAAAEVEEYCGLDAPKPATRGPLGRVLREEARLDPALLAQALRERRLFDLRALAPADLAPSPLEIERIPEGATLVDLRALPAYRTWHHPAALSLEFPHALGAFAALPRDRTYVVYCEVGWKSTHVAERMRASGFLAYHLKGGLGAAMAQAGLETAEERALLAPAVRDDL